MRCPLLHPPGASRDGDGHGLSTFPQNKFCRLRRAEWNCVMAWWGRLHACLTGHACFAEGQVHLKTPWHYGRVQRVVIIPPWCRYPPHLLSTKLAWVQVLAWREITCTGGPNDGLPKHAKKSRESNPTDIPPVHSCVWSSQAKRRFRKTRAWRVGVRHGAMVGCSMSATC